MFPKPSTVLAALQSELTNELNGKHGFWHKSSAPSIIKQIEILGDTSALPSLLNLVHHKAHDIRNAAEDAVAVLLPATSAIDLLNLELKIRESWSSYWSSDAAFRASKPTSCMLTSLDPNGHKREQALSLLEGTGSADVLPFMLLRLNDWVEPVRIKAQEWLTTNIAEMPLLSLVKTLPITAALVEREKGTASGELGWVLERLHADNAHLLLAQSMTQFPARTRRLVFRIFAESGALLKSSVQEFILRSGDAFLGVLFLSALRQRGQYAPVEWLKSAVNSKSPMLRRAALQSFVEALYPDRNAILSVALLDNASGVRDYGRYWMRRQNPSFDLKQFYQQAFEDTVSSRQMVSSIAGFHECGGKWSPEDYLRLLEHALPTVRLATLRAFAFAYPDLSQNILEECLLGNKGAALEKLAYTILRTRPATLSLSFLREALDDSRQRSSRIRGLELLMLKDKWQSLPVLLILLRDHDETFGGIACDRLRAWLRNYNRTWTQPTRQSLEEIQTELIQSKDFLEPAAINNLTSIVEHALPVS